MRLKATAFGALFLAAPAYAEPPLGGVAARLGCSLRAYAECAGAFCYDATRGETSGTTSVTGPSSWAFQFDFKNKTASVGEDYAKDFKKQWPMRGLAEGPAVVNKPMFVKFSLRTDAQQLFVLVVATPLPEARGYSFGYGVVSRGPFSRQVFLPGVDKTISTGKCTVE